MFLVVFWGFSYLGTQGTGGALAQEEPGITRRGHEWDYYLGP